MAGGGAGRARVAEKQRIKVFHPCAVITSGEMMVFWIADFCPRRRAPLPGARELAGRPRVFSPRLIPAVTAVVWRACACGQAE